MLHYRKYTQLNDAPWVVFVHGAGGSSSLWFKQIREFRHYFNIILVDLRGHGKSNLFLEGIYKEQFTLREATEDIIEVLDTENIHQAHFIGMSLGSVIIRELAEIAPERISSIILGGAVTKFNIRSQLLLKMVYFLKRIIPFMWLYKCLAFAVMPRKRNRESRLIFINDAKKISRSEYLRWFHLISEANPLLCSL
ncbi:MAG: alpha/beta fold hydrolase, partial [Lentisphaeria bacterium]